MILCTFVAVTTGIDLSLIKLMSTGRTESRRRTPQWRQPTHLISSLWMQSDDFEFLARFS
jgi:hypothetical protein